MLAREQQVAYKARPELNRHPLPQALATRLHRFTASDYLQLAETGMLDSEKQYELVEGQLVEMSAVGTAHLAFQGFLHTWATLRFHPKFLVFGQSPLALDDFNEPEPDLLVAHARPDYYGTAKPIPADVVLVVEVGVNTLELDLTDRRDRYARHRIPEYWVMDAANRQLHFFDQPADGVYRRSLVLAEADSFTSPLAGLLNVADLMPPSPQPSA